VIALDAVSKGYGGQSLLRAVSWRIGRGERIGLCGPNGTGKTTLCRILAGVEDPDSGRVHRDTGVSVGYLPQEVGASEAGTVLAEALSGFDEVWRLEAELERLAALMAAEDAGPELTEEQKEQLYAESLRWYRLYGVSDRPAPANWSGFSAYFERICADVLEHLIDPWAAVDKIAAHLKKGGLLIVSIPNIREWKTLARIVFKGEFSYRPEGGIMDKTHLRFFCKKNIYQLLTTPSLSPFYCKPNFMLKEVPQGKFRRVLNLLSFRLFEDFLTVQYLFVAKKK